MKKIITLFIAAAFSFSVYADPQDNTTTPLTQGQVKQFELLVHDYLVHNPQVLVEASNALQAQQEAAAQSAAESSIIKYKHQLFNDPATPYAGNQNGNVTLTEFFDYQCPHCKVMNQDIQTLIKKNPHLKVVFKELPIFGGDSQFASEAALAAAKQGKYFELHDALLAVDNPITQDKVWAAAKKVGLDIKQLKQDMSAPDVQQQIKNNTKLAESLKLMGTPTFVISNGNHTQFKLIPGQTTVDDLQNKINALSRHNS